MFNQLNCNMKNFHKRMMKNKFYAILAMILHTTFLNKKCFLQSKFL